MNEINLINEAVLERFFTLFGKGRLAHAYIFIGPEGAGKTQTALSVAKMVNCEGKISAKSKFCDVCGNCVKINSKTHPDIYVIKPVEGQTIKIEQAREMIKDMKLKSFMGKFKVGIIKDAENLTGEAANALLKTLEEPTGNTLLILTTSVLDKILPTVQSRCQAVNFAPVPADKINSVLRNELKLNEAESQYLARVSEGCLGKAQSLLKEGNFARKNYYLDEIILAYDYEKALKSVLADKDEAKNLLLTLQNWLRDAILLKSGVEDKRLVNLDRLRELKRFAGSFEFAELNKIYEEAAAAFKAFHDNLNVKINLMLIKERMDK